MANPLSPIAHNVRRLRLQRGWSQQMLAAHANVSVQTIRNIENGWVWWPQAATMMGLAHALGVSPRMLRTAPPEGVDDWRSYFVQLEQQRLGALWVEENGLFVIDPAGSDSDVAAAADPVVKQLHQSVSEKARKFNEVSKRLDNAIGWHGIAVASQRFTDGVRKEIEAIPGNLGIIYSAILELGSFLEQDIKLQKGLSSSADPLDPEVHRILSDLIRTAAPWLRRFPTIRELDDESAAFLTRADLLNPGTALIRSARETELVSAEDAALINGLLEAARRGEYQSDKAKTRSILSIRNLLYVSATVALAFLSNAAASGYAEQSALIHNAGNFLAKTEATTSGNL